MVVIAVRVYWISHWVQWGWVYLVSSTREHHAFAAQTTHPGSTDDLSQIYIHPVITADKMAIVSFSIF